MLSWFAFILNVGLATANLAFVMQGRWINLVGIANLMVAILCWHTIQARRKNAKI